MYSLQFVGKINVNSQCGRSPDMVPFSARRSSAMGVMSVQDALLEFSIPTVVTYNQHQQYQQMKKEQKEDELITRIKEKSAYLQPLSAVSSSSSTTTTTSKD